MCSSDLATFATNSVVSGILKIGSGSATGEVTSNGAYDLVLSTNSGTKSSEIQIIDAANGDVDITLNGTGAVNINGTTTHNDALVVAAGDVQITAGGLTLTDDQNAESVTIINNTATTIGAAVTSGVVQIESTSLTTGAALNVQLTEGTLNGGFYYSAWDATGGSRVFSVGENGAVTVGGAAASDVLTVTAGDVSIADGSLTIADADNALTVSVTNNTATTADVVAISATAKTTAGSILDLVATGGTITTGDYLTCNDSSVDVFAVRRNGHLATRQSTKPTIAVGVQNGITAAAVSNGSTDTAGIITTTGTSLAGDTVFTVTFEEAYAVAPVVLLQSVNEAAAQSADSATSGAYVSSTTTTTFVVTIPGASGATPSWTYYCCEIGS